MNDLERFNACMTYGSVDHHPFWAWGGWPETLERWQREGFRRGVDDPDASCDRRTCIDHWFFPNPRFERKVIEQTDAYVVYVNHEGILMKERRDQPYSSMPQFLKFPVASRQEFREFWRDRMKPDLSQRIGADLMSASVCKKRGLLPSFLPNHRRSPLFPLFPGRGLAPRP